RSRPSLVLFAPGDCRIVPADLRAGSAGGAAVYAVGLHQNLLDVVRHSALGYLGSRTDGPPDPGAHPSRSQESVELAVGHAVSTDHRRRPARPVADARTGGSDCGIHGADFFP